MKDQPITIRAVRAYSLPSIDNDKAIKNNHSISDVWNESDNNVNKCIINGVDNSKNEKEVNINENNRKAGVV